MLFKKFTIHTPRWNPSTYEAEFYFSFENGPEFVERIGFGGLFLGSISPKQSVSQEDLQTLLGHAAIAIGVSYYKLSPCSAICVESVGLSEEDIHFWQTLYRSGLGEFLYKNQIRPETIATQWMCNTAPNAPLNLKAQSSSALVPLGGGKDSLVAAEMVRSVGMDFCTFNFGRRARIHTSTAEVVGVPNVGVSRMLDPTLVEWNAKSGAYNGHVPITGIITFILFISLVLTGKQYGIFANESSASEGNIDWDGFVVNHQYAKSIYFEQDFDAYTKRNFSPDIRVFSILRPLHEIGIAQRFSKYPQYLNVFSSCNRNFHLGGEHISERWCGECPKCAFTWALLSAFVPPARLSEAFGQNLFEREDLLPLYRELLGIAGHKPFECVGSAAETALAFALARENFYTDAPNRPVVMHMFEREVLTQTPVADILATQKELLGVHFETTLVPTLFRQVFGK